MERRPTQSTSAVLRQHGIKPSAQRLAVAEYVLNTKDHPTADVVFLAVGPRLPMLSRATVYNTLALLVSRGLLRVITLDAGRIVYDPKTDRHHHFIEQSTGRIHDVPWNALKVENVKDLEGYQVNEYQVVMRGRLKKG
jgi:Fe2+ or Zn2+ uptake regulation protein